MPGPWRHEEMEPGPDVQYGFQSQPRCQAPGDLRWYQVEALHRRVSISTEMPGPWRHFEKPLGWDFSSVSISTEMPGPWRRLARLQRVFPGKAFLSQARWQDPRHRDT